MHRVLAVVAHPDDEVLGAAGFLAKLAAERVETAVLIFGEGPTSRPDGEPLTIGRIGTALRMLGGPQIHWLKYPDQRFDRYEQLDLNHAVEKVVQEFAPDTILTHDRTDLNRDHLMVAEAALVATRPGGPVQRVWTFEVACSSEWAFGERFRPNKFIPLTDEQLLRKIRALELYGEIRPYPHPRSAEAIEAQARCWGVVAGVPLAEAFRVVREVG